MRDGLFAATRWIDVAIPGVGGLLLALGPRLFIKPSGNPEADASKARKIRFAGLMLLGVAGIYWANSRS
jgi:hypothetical protein